MRLEETEKKPGTDDLYNSLNKYICTDGNGEKETCDTVKEVVEYIWDNDWAWI